MIENSEPLDNDAVDAAEDGKSRQRSTIAFPYSDYEGAEVVASAIHSNVGHGVCSAASQLAPWMKVSSKSSGFRTQISAARLFGLIESDNAETYRLTDLGIQIFDPAQARSAKAAAFLRVPLFNALYEKYKGGVIPPHAALEREIVSLGVSEKQKTRARQIFESSAEQTGFREQGPNRLVMPAVVILPKLPADSETKDSQANAKNNAGNVSLDLDPLLLALLQKIPSQGGTWPAEKRLRWFKTFAMNVSQVYDEDDEPVELKIVIEAQ